MADRPKTVADWLADGSIHVPKLEINQQVILESVFGSIYELKLLSTGKDSRVLFFANLPNLINVTREIAIYQGALPGVKGVNTLIPDYIIKGCRMKVEWPGREMGIVTEAIATATIYGDGWHYTVIQ